MNFWIFINSRYICLVNKTVFYYIFVPIENCISWNIEIFWIMNFIVNAYQIISKVSKKRKIKFDNHYKSISFPVNNISLTMIETLCDF